MPHRSTTTIAPAANETAQEELAREVGYADIVTAEARQRRQAAWNGIAGNWLLPIAVAAGVVYLMAPALSLLVRPADHPTQAILSGAVGVLIGICWLIQRVFTPSWRSKQATKRATGLAGVRQELDEAMAVRLQTPRQAATIAQIEAIAERGIDKARAAETKDRDVGR